jgi:Bifunctional DNA primase/polymerase, N-terminal
VPDQRLEQEGQPVIPESSILDTAIAAHQAGLCPIRAKADGSKAPYGPWKQYMEGPPGLDDIMSWFPSWPNLGLVCGTVSDRLVMVEFEGRFMEHFTEAARRLSAADLGSVWESWLDGYCERTPGGGLHVLIHVGGDGPVPGNIKVASDGGHQTLIETRGEGGFVIIAPSNGSTHPSGGRWERISGSFDEIAWATPEEFAGVLGVLASFNVERVLGGEKSSPPPSPQRMFDRESWVDRELAQLHPVSVELERRGWTFLRDEPAGQLWKRPDKREPGHSARVNPNGRLYVFSSSTPLTPSDQLGDQTYDTLDVILAYELGRNPTSQERVAWLRARKGGDTVPPRSTPSPQLTGEDTGGDRGDGLWLPGEFWDRTPILSAIRDAALASMLSPEGVLGAFLSCYATTVPMSIKLPKIVGAPSPLNIYSALVARSGGGKSTSMALAMDLLGYGGRNRHVLLNRSLRSGEGLVTLAIYAKGDEETGPIYNNAVQVCFDEGGTLAAQASRNGSTTISYLNTAWAGHGVVGGALAGESKSFPADLVRVCAVMGVQFGVCANLFTGEAASLGFPQRLLFFGLENPVLGDIEVTTDALADVEALPVKFWDHGEFANSSRRIEVPDHIVLEVRRWSQQRNLGHLDDPLDSHQMLLRLRTASAFMLMNGRGVMEDEDWEIADAICATSRTIRSQLIRSISTVTVDRERLRGQLDNVRAQAADAAWLEDRAQMLVGHLLNANEGMTRKELRAKLRNTARPRLDEIIDHGVARGLIRRLDDRYWGGTP